MSDFQPAVPKFEPLPAKTQEELLALFDRLLPDYYLAPLKSPGPGYEYLQAVARMNARVSEAVAHIGSGSFIGSATGGSYATAQVEFYRDNTLFGVVTLKQGTVVGTSDGYLYQTVEDVTFDATDLGPRVANVRAMARGWDWNKPGPMFTASGAVVPGVINRLVAPVVPTTTNNFDPTIQVRQRLREALVYFGRPTSGAGAITIGEGSLLATADGFQYRTMETVSFGTYELYPAFVRATPVLLNEDPAAHGPITQIVQINWIGPTQDPSLYVVQTEAWQTSDAVGGASAMLDGLGADRGIYRTIIPAKVNLARLTAAAGRVVLLAGTRLLTSDGYVFRTLAPVTFEASQLGPIEVEAVPLLQESPIDAPIAYGPLDNFDVIFWGSVNTDITITVTQTQPYSLERDEAYRTRIALLPITVTPNALLRVVELSIGTLLRDMGLSWESREVWDIRYQSAYSENGDLTNGPRDFPINTTLTLAELNAPVPPYSSNIFVYDNPASAASNRYLYPETGMIVFALPNDPDLFAKYKGLVDNLEAAKAAGIALAYVALE